MCKSLCDYVSVRICRDYGCIYVCIPGVCVCVVCVYVGGCLTVCLCVCIVGVLGGNECLAHEKGPSDLNQMPVSVEELTSLLLAESHEEARTCVSENQELPGVMNKD